MSPQILDTLEQTLKTSLGLTIIGALILFVVVTTSNINRSYSQVSQEELNRFLENCTEFDYLVNKTNIKIIDILISKTLKKPCIDDINQLLEKDFTIKGTLQDKFIILEKIK